jgi:hypothetical protein
MMWQLKNPHFFVLCFLRERKREIVILQNHLFISSEIRMSKTKMLAEEVETSSRDLPEDSPSTPDHQIKRRRLEISNPNLMTPPEKRKTAEIEDRYALYFNTTNQIRKSREILESSKKKWFAHLDSLIDEFGEGCSLVVDTLMIECFDNITRAKILPKMFKTVGAPLPSAIDIRHLFLSCVYIASSYTCIHSVHLDDIYRFFMSSKLEDIDFYKVTTGYVRLVLELLLYRVTECTIDKCTRTGEVLSHQDSCLVTYGYVNANNKPVVFKRLGNEEFSSQGERFVDGISNIPRGRKYQVPYIFIVEAIAYSKIGELKHPNLAQILAVQATIRSTYMIFPYYELTLENIKPQHLRECFKGVCEGVKAIHDSGLAHRDLKVANLRFTMCGVAYEEKAPLTKIIDFNSMCLHNTATSRESNTTTLMVRPPEVLLENIEFKRAPSLGENREPRNFLVNAFKIDIWSLGCLLYCFSSKVGEYPFKGRKEVEVYNNIQHILETKTLPEHVEVGLGPSGVDLFWKCCTKSPEDRLTVSEILEHTYFL